MTQARSYSLALRLPRVLSAVLGHSSPAPWTCNPVQVQARHWNYSWKLGKKKGKDCPNEKHEDTECESKEPPKCEPKDDPCDTCPKRRTHVCQDTTVTAKTGMKMPALILGTWKMDDFDVTQKAIKTALKVGYRAIDTSAFYGNEEVLGCAIAPALQEANLKREDIFIITKLPFDAMRCEMVTDSLCRSLTLLKTPYIDLYMINFPAGSVKDSCGKYKPDCGVDLKCVWKAMETAVESGKAKYIGVANFNCDQLEDIVKCSKVKPSNVQVELHTYFQQRSFRRVAKQLGLTITAYAPLGRSAAMTKWLKDMGVEDDRASPTCDPLVQELAKKLCKSPVQVLLRFLLQLDDNLAVVIGASDPKMICENLGIYDFELDEADMFQLTRLDKGKKWRLFDKKVFGLLFPGVEEHPLFPWKDC